METNKEAIVFKLEADSSGLKKTIIDAETLAENAAESTENKVKGAADKASEDVSAATEKIQADVAKSSAKSAAKAMRDLMGFDEINRLSGNSGSTDTGSAASAGQTPASTTDNSTDKDKTNALADSLQHIKKLWDDLYGSFKKGLTTRLDAGNVFDNLGSIKKHPVYFLRCMG